MQAFEDPISLGLVNTQTFSDAICLRIQGCSGLLGTADQGCKLLRRRLTFTGLRGVHSLEA